MSNRTTLRSSSPENCPGGQVDFVRRKPNAGCYVGAATRLATLERACECEEADYECDFCYERMVCNLIRSRGLMLSILRYLKFNTVNARCTMLN